MKKSFYIFIISIISYNAYSQVNIDSLWDIWNDESQADTVRLKAMKKISWDGYLFTQTDSAFYFAGLQYEFAKKKGIKKHMAEALNTQGISFYFQSNYTKAIEYYSKSLKIFELIGDEMGIASSLNNIGMIKQDKGDYDKAIEYHSKSLKIAEELEDQIGIASSLNNIGNIYKDQEKYNKAIEYYSKSLKIVEELEDKMVIAATLNNIGNIYNEKGDYDKAIEYYSKSLKIESLADNKKGIARCLNNIGEIFLNQGDYNKAIEHFSKSLKINEENADKMGISVSLNNIGETFLEQGDYYKALDYSSRSLSINQEIGANLQTKESAKKLWIINKSLSRYKQALFMHELYIATRDTLESEKNHKAVIRQEYKYQYEKQAAEDSIKAAEEAKVKDAMLLTQRAENKQQSQQKYFLYGVLALALLFGGFIFNRFRITSKQKGIIEEQKIKVDEAFEQLEEKNTEIVDSINYAKRIQSAILPTDKIVKEYLQKSFILYKPKDIVAGDFYWLEPMKDGVLFAAADCTGHGVPGAMVSVICNNGLNRSIREHNLSDPGQILDKTREIIITEFEKSEEEVKDGMDIALCALAGNKLTYAGANNPLWIVRKDAKELEEIKANKQPIGKFEKPIPYTSHTIDLNAGDSLYIFSDGFADQFGGEKEKKFKSNNFKKLILSIQHETMDRQFELIDEAFEKWKGNLNQLDDVCVFGVRI